MEIRSVLSNISKKERSTDKQVWPFVASDGLAFVGINTIEKSCCIDNRNSCNNIARMKRKGFKDDFRLTGN